MNNHEQKDQSELLLGRFIKQKLLEKTQRYARYSLKDVYGGQRGQIKVQSSTSTKPTVLHQAGFLQQMQGHQGYPLMIWSGNMNQKEIALVTEKIGPNLQELMKINQNQTFTLETVCHIGLQTINILETLHKKNSVLDLISPQIFRINPSQVNRIMLANLYYCRRFRSSKTLKPYEMKKVEEVYFVNDFLSKNALERLSRSRRDDMQSLFYLLVYFRKGKLPWSKICLDSMTGRLKMVTRMLDGQNEVKDELLSQLPAQFRYIFEHITSLSFEDKPDYWFITLKLKKILLKQSKVYQKQLDWIKHLPSLRKESLKPQELSLKTAHDIKIERLFYAPVEEKITLDNIGHVNGIFKKEGHKIQSNGSVVKLKKKKNNCMMM